MLTLLAVFAGAGWFPPPQQALDSTRVSYRTRDVVFVAAGRAERLAVGDTLRIAHTADSVALAVVTSIAEHSASARLVAAAPWVAVGDAAAWQPRPEVLAVQPPADTMPRDTTQPPPAPVPEPRPFVAPRRVTGGIQLEQLASGGGPSSVSTSQTIGALALGLPLGAGAAINVRATSRWRGGASSSIAPGPSQTTQVYQLELALGTPRSPWSAGLGRFLPSGMMALGWLDGLRLEFRPGAASRPDGGGTKFGVVAGFVPSVVDLSPSTSTSRAGAYWTLVDNDAISITAAAAADWAQGAHRRTQVAGQAAWRPFSGLSFSAYGDADLGAAWDTTSHTRLTTFYGSMRTAMPLGFHATVGVESHQAVRLWENWSPGDTLPLPGRITGVNGSLDRRFGGWFGSVGGGWLQRQGDPSGTLRANLTLSHGLVMFSAMGQHGDLLDYGALLVRFGFPRVLGLSGSLGGMATVTQTSGGGTTLWRLSLRPEVSKMVGAGLYLTAGGDIGTYAGSMSSWLHAGVSYRFH